MRRPAPDLAAERPGGVQVVRERRPLWTHRIGPVDSKLMWSKREVIDYALQRRNTLQALQGRVRSLTRAEACDADPMLIRSALHHGEPHSVPCPICKATTMVLLRYVFGAQLGQYSGRIRSTAELDEMQSEFGEFKVRVVEVCHECGWNHMIETFLLGDGVARKPPRRKKTVEDIYG